MPLSLPHKSETIIKELAPLYQQLRDHSLYARIATLDDLIVFMSHHVYSVWDFMNLLKTLQQKEQFNTMPPNTPVKSTGKDW